MQLGIRYTCQEAEWIDTYLWTNPVDGQGPCDSGSVVRSAEIVVCSSFVIDFLLRPLLSLSWSSM